MHAPPVRAVTTQLASAAPPALAGKRQARAAPSTRASSTASSPLPRLRVGPRRRVPRPPCTRAHCALLPPPDQGCAPACARCGGIPVQHPSRQQRPGHPRAAGMGALWKGLIPRLARTPPGQAIVWSVSDQVRLAARLALPPGPPAWQPGSLSAGLPGGGPGSCRLRGYLTQGASVSAEGRIGPAEGLGSSCSCRQRAPCKGLLPILARLNPSPAFPCFPWRADHWIF